MKLKIEVPLGPDLLPVTKVDQRKLILEQAQHIIELENELGLLKTEKENSEAKLIIERLSGLQLREESGTVHMASIEEEEDHIKSLAAIQNNLLNFIAIVEINEKNYPLRTILDTGALCCCVKYSALPSHCYEPLSRPASLHGLNNTEETKLRVKPGNIVLNKEKYPLPHM